MVSASQMFCVRFRRMLVGICQH